MHRPVKNQKQPLLRLSSSHSAGTNLGEAVVRGPSDSAGLHNDMHIDSRIQHQQGSDRQASCLVTPTMETLDEVAQPREDRLLDKTDYNAVQKRGSRSDCRSIDHLENTLDEGLCNQANHLIHGKRRLSLTENVPGTSSKSINTNGDKSVDSRAKAPKLSPAPFCATTAEEPQASPDEAANDGVESRNDVLTGAIQTRPEPPVKPALELFTVERNGRKNYFIKTKTVKGPKWTDLCILISTSYVIKEDAL